MNFDRLYKVPKFISAAGDEVQIEDESGTPGGSAANTIYGLAKLKLGTGFIGALGDDNEGKAILNDFGNAGVDASNIVVKSGIKTSTVHGFVDAKGERALYINPGANNELAWEDIDIDFAKNSKMLLLTSFVDDKQFELQRKLVENITQDLEPKIIFSPGALYSKRDLNELTSIIEHSFLCILNREEFKNLTGMEYQEGALKLIDKGVQILAVTLGQDGFYITDGTSTYIEKANELGPEELIDTTGAGDAFATGLIYGLLKGEPLDRCGKLGNAIAAHCIRKMGARVGLPTLSELDNI